jgi:hypothetical protein
VILGKFENGKMRDKVFERIGWDDRPTSQLARNEAAVLDRVVNQIPANACHDDSLVNRKGGALDR